jgi:5-methylcytosine-specific restriction enzyme subunit McrC
MHGICRFFLENAGPGINHGEHHMIPFTVNMPNLFESFVAEWIHANEPRQCSTKSQHRAVLDENGRLHFQIDIVLFDAIDGCPRAVLDTKYKSSDLPSEQDIQQIVAYAVAMGVSEAYLIYPSVISEPVDLWVGPIRPIHVRSLVFDLSGDLEEAGQTLLKKLSNAHGGESQPRT